MTMPEHRCPAIFNWFGAFVLLLLGSGLSASAYLFIWVSSQQAELSSMRSELAGLRMLLIDRTR